MKTQEELNELKQEINRLNEKLKELTPEELEQVSGGAIRAGWEIIPGPMYKTII